MPQQRHLLAVLLTTVSHAVVACAASPASKPTDLRYILLNLQCTEIQVDSLQKIKSLAGSRREGGPRLGVGAIISYFRYSPDQNLEQLRRLLTLCQEQELAVVVQLDGEQWWQARPDLWNWWDKTKKGYDPANAGNVEWSGWAPDYAVKIAWRNWGRQRRVLPPPNLMSPRYREACHAEMKPLLAEIVRWRNRLPAAKQWLLVGVKVGWESAIGMGSYYYPDGNSYLDKDPVDDPEQNPQPQILPGRGFQSIGYAAVSTAGLATEGELQEAHLAEIVQRHLADLSEQAHLAGLARAQIFTHCGGWAEGEKLYAAALNTYSCPGWSLYRHGRDPRVDKTAMAAIAASDAPYWAAVEWLPMGAKTADDWRDAIRNTLTTNGCRYLCIYNWREVRHDVIAQEGIRRALAEPLPAVNP